MDTARLQRFVGEFWDQEILPSITEYIRIPNKSPAFDPKWAEHGYMDDAVRLMEGWARRELESFPGASLDVVRLPGLHTDDDNTGSGRFDHDISLPQACRSATS